MLFKCWIVYVHLIPFIGRLCVVVGVCERVQLNRVIKVHL